QGGIVDATGCTAAAGITGQTTTVSVGSNTQQVILKMPSATYSGSANPLFIISNGSQMVTYMGTLIIQTSAPSNGIILAGNYPGNVGTTWHGGIIGQGQLQGPGAFTSSATGIVWGGSADTGNLTNNQAVETQIVDFSVQGFSQ